MFKYRRSLAVLMWVILSGMCFFFLSSCEEKELAQEKVENIVRVFMHEPGRYSFLIQLSNSSVVTMRTFLLYNCETKFIMDVPKNEKMWAYIKRESDPRVFRTFIDVHIHSVRDVEGAGWNHGKFGKGQTYVIQ